MSRCRPITTRSSAISISSPDGAAAARHWQRGQAARGRRRRACCRPAERKVAACRQAPRRSRASRARTAAGWSMCRCPRPRPNSAIASARRASSPMPACSTCSTSAPARACRRPISSCRRPGQDHALCHLARQARRAGGHLSDQFRSVWRACRRAEDDSGGVLDELGRVPRVPRDAWSISAT